MSVDEPNENAREIIRLKGELERLKDNERRLDEKVRAMDVKLEDTSKKVSTAETWGRAIMYCTFGVGVVITNLQTILAWMRKL